MSFADFIAAFKSPLEGGCRARRQRRKPVDHVELPSTDAFALRRSNTLKALFLPIYIVSLLATLSLSLWQIAQGPPTAGWWGALLAVGVPLAFFARLRLGGIARTGKHLWWIPASGLLGALVPMLADAPGIANAISFFVGVPMGMGYTLWYSRFRHRDRSTLRVGRLLPSFVLDDAEGRSVQSLQLMRQPVIWMFFRGNWCPLCMAQIKEIAAQYRQLAARGVRVALVSSQSAAHTRELAARFDVPMTFLIDRDNQVAARLRILAERGLPMGLELLNYDADVPMPTVLITAPGGCIVYSHLTDNYRVRPEPAALIAAIDRAGMFS